MAAVWARLRSRGTGAKSTQIPGAWPLRTPAEAFPSRGTNRGDEGSGESRRSLIMNSSVTILLLDDEPMLRRATTLMLASRGGRVSAAATPDEAVALAEARLFDVGIIDLS